MEPGQGARCLPHPLPRASFPVAADTRRVGRSSHVSTSFPSLLARRVCTKALKERTHDGADGRPVRIDHMSNLVAAEDTSQGRLVEGQAAERVAATPSLLQKRAVALGRQILDDHDLSHRHVSHHGQAAAALQDSNIPSSSSSIPRGANRWSKRLQSPRPPATQTEHRCPSSDELVKQAAPKHRETFVAHLAELERVSVLSKLSGDGAGIHRLSACPGPESGAVKSKLWKSAPFNEMCVPSSLAPPSAPASIPSEPGSTPTSPSPGNGDANAIKDTRQDPEQHSSTHEDLTTEALRCQGQLGGKKAPGSFVAGIDPTFFRTLNPFSQGSGGAGSSPVFLDHWRRQLAALTGSVSHEIKALMSVGHAARGLLVWIVRATAPCTVNWAHGNGDIAFNLSVDVAPGPLRMNACRIEGGDFAAWGEEETCLALPEQSAHKRSAEGDILQLKVSVDAEGFHLSSMGEVMHVFAHRLAWPEALYPQPNTEVGGSVQVFELLPADAVLRGEGGWGDSRGCSTSKSVWFPDAMESSRVITPPNAPAASQADAYGIPFMSQAWVEAKDSVFGGTRDEHALAMDALKLRIVEEVEEVRKVLDSTHAAQASLSDPAPAETMAADTYGRSGQPVACCTGESGRL